MPQPALSHHFRILAEESGKPALVMSAVVAQTKNNRTASRTNICQSSLDCVLYMSDNQRYELVREKLFACKTLRERNLSQYRIEKNITMPHNAIKPLMDEQNKSINFKTVMQIIRGLEMTPSELFNVPII